MRTYLLTATATFALMATPILAQAQDASPSAQNDHSGQTAQQDSGKLEEIVVTSQRREQKYSDVPVSVSVLNKESLSTTGVTGLSNITVAVPSLSAENINGYLGMHLRGVGSNGNGPGFENPVALYIDGVYYGNQSVGMVEFNSLNISRIEVLKGPQGTLFGRNATGGLVDIITEEPDSKFDFRARASYGNFNSFNSDLYISSPVTDDLAMDFSGRFSRHDGFGTNLATGKDSYNLNHDYALRSKIVYNPGAWKFTLIGDYSNNRSRNDSLTLYEGTRPAPGAPVVTYPNHWDVNTDVTPLLTTKGGGVSLKVEGDFDLVTASDIVAYRQSKYFNRFDYDGTPLPITEVEINQKDKQFSNEFHLTSTSVGPLQWVAGLYYYWAKGSAVPISVQLPGTLVKFSGSQTANSIAPYAQLTYALTDEVRLTLGGRYTWETRELDALQTITSGPVVIPLPASGKHTFKDLSFRVALDYKPSPDTLFYVSVSRGFKSGGFNVTDPAASVYKPERLTAYEFGQRAELFDRKLRLNSAFFYYDYKDLQTQIALAAGTGFSNGNAEMYGWNFDATARVTRELTVSGGFNLLHAEYTKYPNALIGTPGGGVPVTIGDVSGNDLNYAPRATFNLNSRYTVEVGGGELSLTAAWLHSSHFFHEADNNLREPSYDLINASAKYTLPGDHYYVRTYINNIADEAIRSNALTIPSGQQIQLMRPPRTYGIEVGVDF